MKYGHKIISSIIISPPPGILHTTENGNVELNVLPQKKSLYLLMNDTDKQKMKNVVLNNKSMNDCGVTCVLDTDK